MRASARILFLSLVLLPAGAAIAAQPGGIRLQTEAEPVSTATVEGGQPIFELLKGLGEAFGIDVVFDVRMRNSLLEIALTEVGPEDAFDRVAVAAGLIWVALDERSVVFAEDNPQMRRQYEPQVVQTFYLEHGDPRSAMTLLRSTMGARSLVADEKLQAITLRDTAARVALARELIERHDRAPAILEIDVRLLRLSAGELERVAGPGSLPPRLGADQAASLVAAGEVVARPMLSLADGAEAGIRIGAADTDSADFELTVTARYAPSGEAISLQARLEGESAGEERRSQMSTQRLGRGETWVLGGLLRVGAAEPSEPDHVVVLLTPRVASPGTVRAADRQPLAVGTEANLGIDPSDR